MSQENVEVVSRAWGSFPSRPDQLRSWLSEYWDPEADYYPVKKWPESHPCHGIEEIGRFLSRFLAAWDHWTIELQQVRPVNAVCVLAQIRVDAQGRESGVKLDADLYTCFWLRRGKCLRVEDHLTRNGAANALGVTIDNLEAAGLSE